MSFGIMEMGVVVPDASCDPLCVCQPHLLLFVLCPAEVGKPHERAPTQTCVCCASRSL